MNNKFLAEVNEKRIALFQIENNYYAISNVCAHMGGPLIDGALDRDGNIVCPWHGYRYDPKTGHAPKGAPEQVETYAVKVDGDDIYVSSEPTTGRRQADEELEFQPETPAKHDDSFVWKCFICLDEYTGSLPPKGCSKCRAPQELIQAKEKVFDSLPKGAAPKPTYAIEEEAVTEYLNRGIMHGEFISRRLEVWRSIAIENYEET